MLELPECTTVARQFEKTAKGKTIEKVVAAQSPHAFAWYNGDPKKYGALLAGQTIAKIRSSGGYVELFTEAAQIIFGEGVNIRFHEGEETLPAKHQLLLRFAGGGAIVCTVQMYGAMFASPAGAFDNPYYAAALEKPSPLGKGFSQRYFLDMARETPAKLSLKAFLATEQRIPGLGNGCLQDILFRAGMNPQTKLQYLDKAALKRLYGSVTTTLTEMAKKGGRDTEKDLFGKPGGYPTILSNKTASQPCPVCGSGIEKKAYLGGKIYFCPICQPAIAK